MQTNKKNGAKILLAALSVVAALMVVVSLIIQLVVIPKEAASITRDYTVVTRDVEGASGHPDVLEVVEEGGAEYIRDDAAAEPVVETIETRPIYEVTQNFEALPSEQAPLKHEVTINGKTYVLDLVEAEYEAVTRERETLSEDVIFEGYTTKPTVDETLPITYKSSTGQELTVEGELESLEKTREYWATYTVKNGTVRLPAGAIGFIYNGKGITYNAADPKWDGWKEDVMAAEGLKESTTQLTDMVWVGQPYDVGGVMHRDLKITGKRLTADWTATYVAKGEKSTAYNATAVYSGYTDEVGIPEEYANDAEYTVNVTVRYSLVSLAGAGSFTKTMAENRNVLPFVSIAFGVVLLACLILLLVMRRVQPAQASSGYVGQYPAGNGQGYGNRNQPEDIVIENPDNFMNEVRDEGVDPPSDLFGDEDN